MKAAVALDSLRETCGAMSIARCSATNFFSSKARGSTVTNFMDTKRKKGLHENCCPYFVYCRAHNVPSDMDCASHCRKVL